MSSLYGPLRDSGDRRNPGARTPMSPSLSAGLRHHPGDLRDERRAVGGTGHLHPNLETGYTTRSILARITPVASAVPSPAAIAISGPAHPNIMRPRRIPFSVETVPRNDITNGLAGLSPDLGGATDLFDATLVEDGDPVGHVERLGLVVGDQHGGDVHLVVQPAQPGPKVFSHFGIQRAERLVEQQHVRVHRQARGPAPFADAGRRRAGWDSGSGIRPARPPRAGCRPWPRSRPWAACGS